MAQADHKTDSWGEEIEQRLKAHFQSADADFTVEQIHCGAVGCLLELTQDKAGRTYLDESSRYEAARTALTDEQWFKDQFMVSYGDSQFTGYYQYWGDSDKFEEVWVFARKRAAK
jgi:hypothetical protein